MKLVVDDKQARFVVKLEEGESDMDDTCRHNLTQAAGYMPRDGNGDYLLPQSRAAAMGLVGAISLGWIEAEPDAFEFVKQTARLGLRRVFRSAPTTLNFEWPSGDRNGWNIRESIKAIPGRFDTTQSERGFEAYGVPMIDEAPGMALEVIEKYDFDAPQYITDALRKARDSYEQFMESLDDLVSADADIPELPGFPMTLKRYQKAGVAMLLSEHGDRAFLRADVRLGKTVMAGYAMGAGNLFPAVVVCTPQTVNQWVRELRRMLPDRAAAIHRFDPRNQELTAAVCATGVMVVGYSMVHRMKPAFDMLKRLGLQTVVIDESQFIKERGSRRSAELRSRMWSGGELTAPHVWALTGVPIMNHMGEIAEQFDLIGRIDDAGGASFLRSMGDIWDRQERENALKKWSRKMLSQGWFMTITREQVADQIGDEWSTAGDMEYIEVPMTTEASEAYRELESMLVRSIASRVREWPTAIKSDAARVVDSDLADHVMARLSEIDTNPFRNILPILTALRRVDGMGKVPAAVGVVQEWLDDNPESKVVVFVWHRDVGDAMTQALGGVQILGGLGNNELERRKDIFINDPHVRVLVIGIEVGGVGLNGLNVADAAFFVEREWSYGRIKNAIGRVEGMTADGEAKTVYVATLMAEKNDEGIGAIDWLLVDRNIDKGVTAKAAVGEDITQEEHEGITKAALRDVLRRAVARQGRAVLFSEDADG